MTEQEALTKWCPFARIFPAGDFWQSSNGRDMTVLQASLAEGDLGNLSRCLGSACMAWRWISKIASQDRPGKSGYCGLAGKPKLWRGDDT